MYGYGGVATLLTPFILLCFASVMVDWAARVLQEVMRRIPWLPNRFWGPAAYLIVFAAGYVFAWQAGFDFFSYLGASFPAAWEKWGWTALLLSGGSSLVKECFGVANGIPQIVSNVFSTVTNFVTGGGTTDPTIAPEPLAQEDDPK
jgi:hypothetical protein